MMYCEKCSSHNIGLYCNQGVWIPTYLGDPNGIIMKYKCYNCNYIGETTMVGYHTKSLQI